MFIIQCSLNNKVIYVTTIDKDDKDGWPARCLPFTCKFNIC